MRKLLLILGISVSASSLLANVGVFSGFGSNLRLSKSEEVQMQSEVVRIRPIPPESPVDTSTRKRVWAEYDCEFVLRNLSDKKVEIQVGFPLANYDYVKDLPRATEERDFKVISHSLENKEQKKYKFDYVSKDKEQNFRALFYWDMTFMPKETKVVNVTYKLAGYYGLGMTVKNPKEARGHEASVVGEELTSGLCQMFGYVTKTGNSWAGEIESAKFIFDLKDFEAKMEKYEVFDLEVPESKTHTENVLLQLIRKGQWSRFLNPEFEKDAEGYYSAHFAPFVPMEDFELIYFIGGFPKDVEGLDFLFSIMEKAAEKSSKKTFNTARKKNVAGIILAFYGIEVDNPEIKAFVEKQRYHKAKFHPKIDEALKEKLLQYANTPAKSELAMHIETLFEGDEIASGSYAGFVYLDKEKTPRFVYTKIDKNTPTAEAENDYASLRLTSEMHKNDHCEVDIYADVKPNYVNKKNLPEIRFKGGISLEREGLATIIQGARAVKPTKDKNTKMESFPCATFIYNKKAKE